VGIVDGKLSVKYNKLYFSYAGNLKKNRLKIKKITTCNQPMHDDISVTSSVLLQIRIHDNYITALVSL
jgi:hypothetical protein